MKVIEIWQTLEKHIDFVFINQFDVPVDDIEKNIQFSSNCQKGSMHIIYKIKAKCDGRVHIKNIPNHLLAPNSVYL